MSDCCTRPRTDSAVSSHTISSLTSSSAAVHCKAMTALESLMSEDAHNSNAITATSPANPQSQPPQSSYEIPLRSMYDMNLEAARLRSAGPPPPPTPPLPSSPSSASSSSPALVTPPANHDASNTGTMRLRSHMLQHIGAKRPTSTPQLPLSFLTTFIRRVFPSDLDNVAWEQSLMALDYLRDLEKRRQREMHTAKEKLCVARDVYGPQFDPFSSEKENEPAAPVSDARPVDSWIDKIEEQSRAAGVLYSKIYLLVRQWTIITEMSYEPFNLINCQALLNTLFPPPPPTPEPTVKPPGPTPHITLQHLVDCRRRLFGYIRKVESTGPRVLAQFRRHDAPQGEATSWPIVAGYVERYLAITSEIVQSCVAVGIMDFGEKYHRRVQGTEDAVGVVAEKNGANEKEKEASIRGHKRQPDSGISFGPAAVGYACGFGYSRSSGSGPGSDITSPNVTAATETRPSSRGSAHHVSTESSSSAPAPATQYGSLRYHAKPLPPTPPSQDSPPAPVQSQPQQPKRPATLERFRKIRSRSDIRRKESKDTDLDVPIPIPIAVPTPAPLSSPSVLSIRKPRSKSSNNLLAVPACPTPVSATPSSSTPSVAALPRSVSASPLSAKLDNNNNTGSDQNQNPENQAVPPPNASTNANEPTSSPLPKPRERKTSLSQTALRKVKSFGRLRSESHTPHTTATAPAPPPSGRPLMSRSATSRFLPSRSASTSRGGGNGGAAVVGDSEFDVEEFRQKRMMWESKQQQTENGGASLRRH